MQEREIDTYKQYSDAWLIDRYFKYGNVEDALYKDIPIPFSYADYHRRLEKAGIVKSAGRQASLSETLHFFRLKQMQPGKPLVKLYQEMPESFRTSLETLHRIYGRVKEVKRQAFVSREATALLILPANDPNHFLVGQEQFSNPEYGKVAGLSTIPMTFSHLQDSPGRRILRVLQQEVLMNDAIAKKFCNDEYVSELFLSVQGPFLKYRLLDVEISCYALSLPENYTNFSSYKLTNHQWVSGHEIINAAENTYRIGVQDIVGEYLQSRGNANESASERISDLNLAIVAGPSRKQA